MTDVLPSTHPSNDNQAKVGRWAFLPCLQLHPSFPVPSNANGWAPRNWRQWHPQPAIPRAPAAVWFPFPQHTHTPSLSLTHTSHTHISYAHRYAHTHISAVQKLILQRENILTFLAAPRLLLLSNRRVSRGDDHSPCMPSSASSPVPTIARFGLRTT